MVTPTSFIQKKKQMVSFFLCQNNLLKVELSTPIEQHRNGSQRSLQLSTGSVTLSRPQDNRVTYWQILIYNCLSLNKLSNPTVPEFLICKMDT